MKETVLYGPSWGKMYHFGFRKWRYAPVSITLTEKRLIVKFLGMIKVRNILLDKVAEISLSNQKWINKWVTNSGLSFSMNFLNNPLVISYEHKSKIKTDFIVTHNEHKEKLLKLISNSHQGHKK